jgi:hypothetical protein
VRTAQKTTGVRVLWCLACTLAALAAATPHSDAANGGCSSLTVELVQRAHEDSTCLAAGSFTEVSQLRVVRPAGNALKVRVGTSVSCETGGIAAMRANIGGYIRERRTVLGCHYALT